MDAISRSAAGCEAALPRLALGLAGIQLNPVVRRVVAMHAAVLALSAPLYVFLGFSFAWVTVLPQVLLLGGLAATAARYAGWAAPRKFIIAETLAATFLVVLFTNVVAPAQYVGVALGFPLVDEWLAAADAALGVNVPALVGWTAARPALTVLLAGAYLTLLPQFLLTLVALGFVHRDRSNLWEFVFHFHVCLAVTLLGVALLPAACAFTYYGFESLIDQSRFISHFEGLRAGTFTHIRFDNIEGLISFPSFHVAGGLIVTWAFRHYRWWLVPIAVLNVLLISATVMTGAHYAIDVVVTVLLFAGSVWLWRRWGRTGLYVAVS